MFVVYLVVAALVVASARPRVAKTPRPAATLAILLPLAMASGQVLSNGRSLYPFIPWTMYGHAAVPKVYVSLRAMDPAGWADNVSLEGPMFWSPGPLRGYSTMGLLTSRLLELRTKCSCVMDDELIDNSIASLARLYYQRTGVELVHVEIVLVAPDPLWESSATVRTLYTWTRRRE